MTSIPRELLFLSSLESDLAATIEKVEELDILMFIQKS